MVIEYQQDHCRLPTIRWKQEYSKRKSKLADYDNSIVPVLLHCVTVFPLLFIEPVPTRIENIHIYYILYVAVVGVTAIYIYFKFNKESRIHVLLKGIINFCCFVPVSCFCGYHLWLAAHVGDTPDNVISYIFGFVFSNFIFYNLLIIHIKKDFEHVNDARKRDTTRPFEQALAEKKILAVYNILFYSHVFVLFFIQILFVIILNNSDISVRFKSVSASSQWEERDKEFVIGAIFVLFLLLIIVAYELCTIVTILQSLYVLCLRKPKRWDAKSSGSLRYREVIRRCRRKFVRWYLPDKEKKAYYANRFEKQNDVV